MVRKVAFGRAVPKTADDWVAAAPPEEAPDLSPDTAPAEPMKRPTIDVPRSLHLRIKAACTSRVSMMVDEIRVLLEREFADQQTR
jgi:hypothetical protein